MQFADHPFRLLGVGTRTKKSEILDRVRDLLLTDDSERVQSAAATITHPTKRIEAELSWFVGIRPDELSKLVWAISGYEELPTDLDKMFGRLYPLTQLNVVYYWLIQRPKASAETWSLSLHTLITLWAKIGISELIELINADRIAAGIPQIVDSANLVDGLKQRQEELIDTIVDQLVLTSSHASVVSRLVEKETAEGTNLASDIVYVLMDRYQAATQKHLSALRDSVREICGEISAVASKGAIGPRQIPDLETLIDTWNQLTLGIQVAMKSRGLEDSFTTEVATDVRALVIDLVNERDLLNEAQTLLLALERACRHTPTFFERITSDLETLDGLIEQKRERVNSSAAVNNIVDLCLAVRANCSMYIVREDAATQANRKLCDTALQRFRQEIAPALTRLPADEKGIRRAQEAAAQCLSGIAIDYTWAEDFVTSETLHIEALKLAEGAYGQGGETWSMKSSGSEPATITGIKEALEKVRPAARRQRLFASITPISSAPSLSTLNGFGFALYGNSDYDAETQSYVSTHYFVALFLPLFPLARYRVINSGKQGYRFLGKLPLRKFDQWHLGIAACVVLFLIILGVVNSSPSTGSAPGTGAQTASAPSGKARELKGQIESIRIAIAALDLKLKPVTAQLKNLKTPMDRLESELKALDVQQKAGIDIDVEKYNFKVDRYNSLLKQYQDLLAANFSDLERYDQLEKKDSELVEQYNRLIK